MAIVSSKHRTILFSVFPQCNLFPSLMHSFSTEFSLIKNVSCMWKLLLVQQFKIQTVYIGHWVKSKLIVQCTLCLLACWHIKLFFKTAKNIVCYSSSKLHFVNILFCINLKCNDLKKLAKNTNSAHCCFFSQFTSEQCSSCNFKIMSTVVVFFQVISFSQALDSFNHLHHVKYWLIHGLS